MRRATGLTGAPAGPTTLLPRRKPGLRVRTTVRRTRGVWPRGEQPGSRQPGPLSSIWTGFPGAGSGQAAKHLVPSVPHPRRPQQPAWVQADEDALCGRGPSLHLSDPFLWNTEKSRCPARTKAAVATQVSSAKWTGHFPAPFPLALLSSPLPCPLPLSQPVGPALMSAHAPVPPGVQRHPWEQAGARLKEPLFFKARVSPQICDGGTAVSSRPGLLWGPHRP